jgi:outer membrane usher protein
VKLGLRWKLVSQVAAASLLFVSLSYGAEEKNVELRESMLAIEFNQQSVSQGSVVLRDADGTVWLDVAEWNTLRLQVPDQGGRTFQGQTYYALNRVQGLSFRIDEALQLLKITASPTSLQANDLIRINRVKVIPGQVATGGFLNYDLFATKDSVINTQSAALELGIFGRWGVGLNTMAFLEGNSFGRGVRLESTWVKDWPKRMTTLRLGDGISRPGSLTGGATRFAGIQYGTNFTTQPQLITSPLLSVSGQNGLPSVADIYVNNNLVERRQLPPGTFTVGGIPAINGSGEVTVVMKDILGREQILTLPFFASADLLAEGLSDFSFEAGVERENYGSMSDDYGRGLVSATLRHGLTNSFTVEVHGELAKRQTMLGAGGAWLLMDRLGVLGAGLAVSQGDETGQGRMGTLSYEFSTSRYSLGARQQWASSTYRQLGMEQGESLPASESNVFAGLPLGGSSLSAGYTRQVNRSEPENEFVTLSYQARLGGRANLLLNYFQSLGGAESKTATVTLSMPFGERGNASVQHRNSLGRGGNATYLNLQESPPAGEGFGWDAQLSDSHENGAGATYRGRYGVYTAEVSQTPSDTSTFLYASGGLGLASNTVFVSRRIEDSFGIVEVPGFEGVRVYQDNQLMGRTDKSGKLLLPQLRAYESNPVRIDHRDLPLDAALPSLRQDVVPNFRAGSLVMFPVRKQHPALITLVSEQGKPLPSSAKVIRVGGGGPYIVGMDGLVYLDDINDGAVLQANFENHVCTVKIKLQKTDDPLQDLGRTICKEVRP